MGKKNKTISGLVTLGDLMKKYPNGFSVGPGTTENPGKISKIVFASSYLRNITGEYPVCPENGGYLVVEMEEEK